MVNSRLQKLILSVLTLNSNKKIMKKIKLFLFTILSIGLFNSCEDAYNIVQDGELNESNAIQTVSDMQKYMNGVYTNVSIGNEIAITSFFTDEVGVGRSTGGQNFDIHRYLLTSGNDYVESMWFGHYTTINRVNRFLLAASKITPPTDPTQLATYNSLIAQAKGLRAFSYLQLLSYFSTDMKNPNALGVVYFTDVPGINEDRPRNLNSVAFAGIEADLNDAEAVLTTQTVSSSNYKFINGSTINAIRARYYLYRGNYTLAKQYAQAVISNSGLSLTLATPYSSGTFYGNSSTNPYRKMFNDTSMGEIIFALDRPASGTWENIAGTYFFNTTSYSGGAMFEVGRKLFNLLSSTPGDIRRYANVDPTSTIVPGYATDPNYYQNDVIIIDKYPGKTVSGYPLRNDLKVFRLSEMYFILAECAAKTGALNGSSNSAAAYIKAVRDARNYSGAQALPTYTNEQDALQDILKERRLELCFEGHRYVDLKRLGTDAGVGIDRDATDDIIPMPTTLPASDYRFTLPIPTAEINANSNIQQNPGY